MIEKKVYLGDGAYISNDGWSVIVECDRENGRNFVHLEPSAIGKLLSYAIEIGLINPGGLERLLQDAVAKAEGRE